MANHREIFARRGDDSSRQPVARMIVLLVVGTPSLLFIIPPGGAFASLIKHSPNLKNITHLHSKMGVCEVYLPQKSATIALFFF